MPKLLKDECLNLSTKLSSKTKKLSKNISKRRQMTWVLLSSFFFLFWGLTCSNLFLINKKSTIPYSACNSSMQEILSGKYHAQFLEPLQQHIPHTLLPDLWEFNESFASGRWADFIVITYLTEHKCGKAKTYNQALHQGKGKGISNLPQTNWNSSCICRGKHDLLIINSKLFSQNLRYNFYRIF